MIIVIIHILIFCKGEFNMNEKDQLIQNINGAMPVAQQMQKIEGEIDQLKDEIERKKKYGCGWMLMIVIAAVSGIIGFIFIAAGEGKKIPSALLCFVIAAVPIVFIIRRFMRSSECKRKIQELEQQRASLQNDPSLAWVPAEYRSGSCLAEIINYVQSGRADSLKEALNLLDEEIHRQQMCDAAALGAFYGAQSRG